jgi:hypothetical protein
MLFLLIIFQASFLYAQEGNTESGITEEPPALTPEQNRINMDIKTSTLSELAAWARSLKLSEAGTSADIAKRLRDYYRITEQTVQAADDKRKIITIESARTTEYFKIEIVDEEYARLTGDVRISLKDGDAIHKIKAWSILYNRTRNILTASGGVEYIKEEGDKIETFRGDSITVDIDNWSSVFLGGVSERSLQSDNTTYLFAGTVMSRDEEGVTVLNKAAISSANNPESLWSLTASRVWLLPGSDFAMLNAVLKVGEIPVLYIPFFYFAADEVLFHPVIGSRTREGPFVQTTTYILGRPKASSSTQSSLTKILGNSNDMEKRREGMFLRSTGKKIVDPDKISLKAIFDHYINLGTYIGMDLSVPAYKILSATNISLGIGLTRTVTLQYGTYTPFFPDYNGESDWNRSNFLSLDVPFRYRFQGSNSISGKYGSLSWSLPYYSDPYVDSDFLKRSEEMDWINMIQQGAASMEAKDSSESQLNPYTWQLSGQLTPQFPKLAPYINVLAINSVSSTIAFKTVDVNDVNNPPKYMSDEIKYYSPSRYFFAPDTATLYTISASISGVPLSFGGTVTRPFSANTEEAEDPLQGIGVPRSPFEAKVKEEAPKRDTTDKLVPPVLNQRFDLPRVGSNNFSIDYRLSPQSASTLRFDSGKWKDNADINWSDVSNIMTNIGGDASANFILNHSEGFYSGTFNFSGNGTWRQYSYINEEAQEYTASTNPRRRIANDKLQEAKQSFISSSYGTTLSVRPLYRDAIFGQSSVAYNLRGLFVRSKFVERSAVTDDQLEEWAENPEWEPDWGEWEQEKINTHSLAANLAAFLLNNTQTFTMSVDLPPREPKLKWETGVKIWITDTSANWGIHLPENEEKWKLDVFNFTERLYFGEYGNFTFNMAMDTEGWDSPETGKLEKRLNSITTSLNLTKWGVSAAFTASRMAGYEYIAGTGWRLRTGEENYILRPKDFSLSVSENIAMKDIFKKITNNVNNIDFSINIKSGLFINLQQYTSSNFTFSLGFTLGINKFLNLSIAAESGNSRIYQYFHDWPVFRDAPIELSPNTQTNLFLDLFDSFRFDNEDLRKRSGFKMKSFRITATHHLGDWNAILDWSMTPYRTTGIPSKFEINNEIAFLIQWIPVNEIKSDITYNKRNSPEWVIKGL